MVPELRDDVASRISNGDRCNTLGASSCWSRDWLAGNLNRLKPQKMANVMYVLNELHSLD